MCNKLLDKYVADFNERIRKDLTFDDSIYLKAAELAYSDAKRAFRGISKYKGEREAAVINLSNKVKEYFGKGTAFNHILLCDSFKNSFKTYKYMTYGGAQKVVNLTFKYLYCCREFRDKYKDKFKNCHMAIDSYILEWYKRKVDFDNECGIKPNETWSHLNDYKVYKTMQDKISAYVSSKAKELNVLEYEFILWPNTVLYGAAVAWLSVVGKNIKKVDLYKDYPFAGELIKQITQCKGPSLDDALKNVL